MHELHLGERDLLSFLKPDTLVGAAIYLALFVLAALLLARALRAAVHVELTRQGHIDRTTISFAQQIGTAAIWIMVLILYAHLIPELRAMGTALLAGASVASVVIGLAAQSTLGNLIAGVSITLYRPFRLGDTLLVTAPTGTEVGIVELISLGYTTLRTADGRLVVLPNSLAASQVTINFREARSTASVAVAIRIGRQADADAARTLALRVGREVAGEGAAPGCFVTRIEAGAAVLELRVRPPQGADRDALRSQLLTALARAFAQAGLDAPDGERAAFS
ncbi:MAG TPA: mechanosensitive ion channel family protein [Steroidobacteraceae bacterium]|nr:mechanosensitive ion channel family protein [Steroidobacteraceae bacterium]